MTACLCPSCAAIPGPTYTADWMRECEAQRVLGLPGKPERHAYLDLVAKRRGPTARAQLEAEVVRQWNQGRK
ncbi:DUF7696 family protein [Cupriavidus basilensis]